MLEHSILGKLYAVWIRSGTFALLQWIYRGLYRAVTGSAILRAIFQEGRLERAFRDSLTARVLDALSDAVRRLFGGVNRLLGLSAAADGSLALRSLRGSALVGELGTFEGLFCVFLMVMFLVPHKYWNNLYAVLAAFAFLSLYLLLAGAGRRRWEAPATVLGLGGTLFVLALVLSMGFTIARRDSLRVLLFFLASLSFCYVIAVDFREPARLRRLLAHLYVALLCISLYAIIQNVFGLVAVNESFTDVAANKGVPGRVYATLDNPINLSEFILLFMPLGAAFAAGAKKPWLRVLLALGLAFPALAMLMTYARGGWIAILLAAGVFTFFCNKRLIPALFVLILLAIPFLPGSVMTRLATMANSKDSSALHRLQIWQGVARLLRDDHRFFTGIGLGPECFRLIYPSYSMYTAKYGAYHTQMHYLELVLELGVMGLVSFLYLMGKTLGRAGAGIRGGSREIRLILTACISSVAALALVGFIEYIWFYQRVMFAFFIYLGILLAAAGCARDQAAAAK